MGKGAGTRSTADVAVFTSATFSVEPVRGVERPKYLGIAVHLYERTGTHTAATEGQESGWIDLSQVGDEDDAVTVANLESSVN
jgi:hypothetical protein